MDKEKEKQYIPNMDHNPHYLEAMLHSIANPESEYIRIAILALVLEFARANEIAEASLPY